jgi:hypothetical protein
MGNAELSTNRRRLALLRKTLSELVAVKDSINSIDETCQSVIDALIRSEIFRLADLESTAKLAIDAKIDTLNDQQMLNVETHCLYYGCDSLIRFLVRSRIKTNLIVQEEAVHYVQDRLLSKNFHRITQFQLDRGVTFKTYIWQVINNLLIDFIRKYNSTKKKQGNSDILVAEESTEHLLTNAAELNGTLSQPDTMPEAAIDGWRVKEAIRSIFVMNSLLTESAPGSIGARLRPYLDLTHYERLFLKSLFVHELSIGEVRRLPIFNMGQNEAYRFYYGLIQKLLDIFKRAGVVDDLRLAIEGQTQLQVEVEGDTSVISLEKLIGFQEAARERVRCFFIQEDGVMEGCIRKNYAQVKNQAKSCFTEVDAQTLIADWMVKQWLLTGKPAIEVPEIPLSITVKGKYLKSIKRQFLEKVRDSLV